MKQTTLFVVNPAAEGVPAEERTRLVDVVVRESAAALATFAEGDAVRSTW